MLVAGSNGWFNYRHQADVCHAYQIVHGHGVPDDHIIVMMYDVCMICMMYDDVMMYDVGYRLQQGEPHARQDHQPSQWH